MKGLVVYQSRYGATEEYARLIARELGLVCKPRREVKPAQLAEYDLVVYGGGLYAGGIAGAKLVAQAPCKQLVVFTVGLTDPADVDFAPILQMSFPPKTLAATAFFHFRGGIDYTRLSLPHRVVLYGLKGFLEKKSLERREKTENTILETYGKTVSFFDPESVAPLVEHVRGLFPA